MLKKFRLLFDLSFGCFVCTCAVLLLIPFADFNGTGFQKAISYIIGIIFWLSLGAGFFLFLKANARRRTIEQKMNDAAKQYLDLPRVGVLMFFRNREAVITDVLFLISLVLLTIVLAARITNGMINVAALFFTTLTFTGHSYANGRNYKYLVQYKKYLKKKKIQEEQQRENDDREEISTNNIK